MEKTTVRSAAREISYTAMFVAIIAVCAWIAIPLPSNISITLQTMGVCLAAGFLGWKRGLIAVAVYILLGLCGRLYKSNKRLAARGGARCGHGRRGGAVLSVRDDLVYLRV